MNISTIKEESHYKKGIEKIADCFGHDKYIPDIFNKIVDSTINLFEISYGNILEREQLVKEVPTYPFSFYYGRNPFRKHEKIKGENFDGKILFSEVLRLNGDPEELNQNMFAVNIGYDGDIKNEKFSGSFNLCFSPYSNEHLMYFISLSNSTVQRVLPLSFRLDIMSERPDGKITENTLLIPESKSLIYSSRIVRNPYSYNDVEWGYSSACPEIGRWKKGDFIGVLNDDKGLRFDYQFGQKEVIQKLRNQARILEEQANIAESKIYQ